MEVPTQNPPPKPIARHLALLQDELSSEVAAPLLHVLDLGLVAYDTAWALQKRAAAARISGALPHDLLILCEHPPVVTLGRSTKPGNLLASPEYLGALGIQLRDVERGGDVTIHEPGQLVAYPIIDLKQHTKDLHWYLRQVEAAIMHALASLGLDSTREAGLTGVWRERRKLASIGVHARDWVTWHGVALNVHNDLETFRHVVPCGIDQVTMTTVAAECGALGMSVPEMPRVRAAVVNGFAKTFALSVAEMPTQVMERLTAEQG